jgi:hypothetical protein
MPPPADMAVGLTRGIKVILLVWTCIVTLDDRYVVGIVATYLNQGSHLKKNCIQK